MIMCEPEQKVKELWAPASRKTNPVTREDLQRTGRTVEGVRTEFRGQKQIMSTRGEFLRRHGQKLTAPVMGVHDAWEKRLGKGTLETNSESMRDRGRKRKNIGGIGERAGIIF